MDTALYYVIRIAASLGIVFIVNVVLVALKTPKWAHPLSWAAWFGDRLVDIGGWLGKQFGRLYVWAAQVLTDCLERIVPALRQSTKDLLSFLLSPLASVAEFFGRLWTTLCNSPYVGALGGFFVSPVVVFALSVLAFALALYAGHSHYPQYWKVITAHVDPFVVAFFGFVLLGLVVLGAMYYNLVIDPPAPQPPVAEEPPPAAAAAAAARRNPPRRAAGVDD
jgi:hypothetical protein